MQVDAPLHSYPFLVCVEKQKEEVVEHVPAEEAAVLGSSSQRSTGLHGIEIN